MMAAHMRNNTRA